MSDVLKWSMHKHYDLLSAPHLYRPGMAGLTETTLTQLLQEKDRPPFELVIDQAPPKSESGAQREAIGKGEIPCPHCGRKDHAGSFYRRFRGRNTKVEVDLPSTCSCFKWRLYYRYWHNPKYVSLEHRDSTWARLARGDLRKTRLAGMSPEMYNLVLAVLQAFPFYNTLILGVTGTGKSTLATALHDRALSRWVTQIYAANLRGRLLHSESVWKVETPTLIEEFQAWTMRDLSDTLDRPTVQPPTCTTWKIESALKLGDAFPLQLCLDEFDKWKCTEHKSDEMYKLINEMYRNGGKLVVASNSTVEKLINKLGNDHGEPTIRRLIDGPQGILIDLHRERVYVNRIRYTVKGCKLVPTNEILPLAKLPTSDLAVPIQQQILWEGFLLSGASGHRLR